MVGLLLCPLGQLIPVRLSDANGADFTPPAYSAERRLADAQGLSGLLGSWDGSMLQQHPSCLDFVVGNQTEEIRTRGEVSQIKCQSSGLGLAPQFNFPSRGIA